jgi:hypothetical protein
LGSHTARISILRLRCPCSHACARRRLRLAPQCSSMDCRAAGAGPAAPAAAAAGDAAGAAGTVGRLRTAETVHGRQLARACLRGQHQEDRLHQRQAGQMPIDWAWPCPCWASRGRRAESVLGIAPANRIGPTNPAPQTTNEDQRRQRPEARTCREARAPLGGKHQPRRRAGAAAASTSRAAAAAGQRAGPQSQGARTARVVREPHAQRPGDVPHALATHACNALLPGAGGQTQKEGGAS